MLANSDIWELTDEEAAQLASTGQKALSHYTSVPGFDEKTVDTLMFLQAAGFIYGARVMMARQRAKEARVHAATVRAAQPRETQHGVPPQRAAQSGGAPASDNVINIPGVPPIIKG